MGVRFQCPNGHALHVKAHLAGKRGICPECNARFIVPSFNGGRVSAVVGNVSSSGNAPKNSLPDQSGSTIIAAAASSSNLATPMPRSDSTILPPGRRGEIPSSLPADESQEPAVEWYVRPALGGQYGPASTRVFQQWIEEGRVANDSLVWRTGWPDWRSGEEAVQQVAAPPGDLASTTSPALTPAPANPLAAASEPSVSITASNVRQLEGTTAQSYRAERRRRKQRIQRITLGLALATLVLAVTLLIVLNR